MRKLSQAVALLALLAALLVVQHTQAADLRITLTGCDARATQSHGECRMAGQLWAPVGSGPACGPIDFQVEIAVGQSMDCRVWSSAPGYADSPRSDLGGYVHTADALNRPNAPAISKRPAPQ